MLIEIKHRLSQSVLFSHDVDHNTIKKTLEAAIKKNSDLSGSNLSGCDLSGCNLRSCDLIGSNLIGCDLSGSNLSGSNLSSCDLRGCDLSGCDLRYSDLRYSDLSGCDLSGSNLRYSDLIGSNLSGSNLSGIYISITTAGLLLSCPEEGQFVGYKKAGGFIVKLLILDDAKRSSATTAKCRCSKAKVLSIESKDKKSTIDSVASDYDSTVIYKVGETVEVNDFDDDRFNECSTGIHFFMNRMQAEQYD